MTETNEFINVETLATLGGAILVVTVVVNSLTHVRKKKIARKWKFVVCQFSALFASFINSHWQESDWYLILPMIFFNGCLIYVSCFAIQNTVVNENMTQSHSDGTGGTVTLSTIKETSSFWSAW